LTPISRTTGDSFVKSIDLSDGGISYRIEKEKARQMTDVLAAESELTTPALLEADDDRGTLRFEPLPPLHGFTAATSTDWFARAGRALALVHEHLVLEGDLVVTRSVDRGREGLVFVHGDFGLGNLGIADGMLVIFDWGIRPWASETYTRASPSIDLASFLAPWIRPRWWDLRLPASKLGAMIEAYLSEVGPNSSISRLASATLREALFEQYRHRRGEICLGSRWRQPLDHAKLSVNRFRLDRALAKYMGVDRADSR
jgi:hypothetical protein